MIMEIKLVFVVVVVTTSTSSFYFKYFGSKPIAGIHYSVKRTSPLNALSVCQEFSFLPTM